MASIDQVIQQICFGLENLSERNGHHEFEHLCRHFVRKRICVNVLPATGPVAAGGDQGRDFETFRTFITDLGEDKFAGVAGRKRLAFCCSLQRNTTGKIRTDVTRIAACDPKPDTVYFLSSRAISVSSRHKHQEWARKLHHLELEVIDREALSEQLSDPQLFWIAVRYLNVPPEIYPAPPSANQEYKAKKAFWGKITDPKPRYPDFVEFVQCGRHALDNSPQDLPFWISLLETFESSQTDASIRSQAAYEIIVLTQRQTRSLGGQEGRIREYLKAAEHFQYPDEVEKAQTILSYVVGTHRLGEAGLTDQEIHGWWLWISEKIKSGIKKPSSPSQLCAWLRIQGGFFLAGGVQPETPPDVKKMLASWIRVANLCSKARAFPVQDFHDELFNFIELIGERPEFEKILKKLRCEIAKRTGDAAVAESHFKRAKQYNDQKKFVLAIRELHNAKVKWFSEETLEQSISCCILLARSYSHLSLHYAALYYALAAGFIAANAPQRSLNERLYECLSTAVEAAYGQGHWCLFSELVESLLVLHTARASNPGSIEEHEYLQWLVANLPVASLVIQRIFPTNFERFMNDVRHWGLENLIRKGMEVIREPIDKWSDEELACSLKRSFTGPPFSDAGEKCETVWSALGIRWHVRWNHSYTSFKVAGEVVAFLQIATAEFAACDLDVIPGEFYADIEMTTDQKLTAEALPDNTCYRWLFRAPQTQTPGHEGMNEFTEQMLMIVVKIVRACSVMPSKRFNRLIIRGCGSRVFGHGMFARRFPELIGFFLPETGFRINVRTAIASPIKSEDWKPTIPPELQWVSSVHPEFDEVEELKRIGIRYNAVARGLKFTLKRIIQDPTFRSTVMNLRTKGWKDWHILQALMNVVANYRTNRKVGTTPETLEWVKVFKQEFFSEEREDSVPVPNETFSETSLYYATITTVLSTMQQHWGLELHPGTPNVEGLLEYLGRRWRYWELDVKHDPLLEFSRTDERGI